MSRSRALIEAYASPPDQRHEASAQDALHEGDREIDEDAIVRAFDFLDSCVLPLEAHPSRAVQQPDEESTPAADSVSLPIVEPKHSAWRLPRGLIYWLSVAAAATITWRLTTSLLDSAIAALTASAVVILVELALRTIDPRIARRLGLARGRSDAVMYAAGAALGVGAGIAIPYLL
jgi:hypothetical protein